MNFKALTAAIDKCRVDLEIAMSSNRTTFTHIAELFNELDVDLPGDPSERHLSDDQIERLYHAEERLVDAVEAITSVMNELRE